MSSQLSSDDEPRPRRRRKAVRRGWNPLVVGGSVAGIVLVVVAVAWIAVRYGKSRRGDSRLIGTWQSDANATIAGIKAARTVTDTQEAAMRKLFGRMKLTYTADTITTELDGPPDTQPYQVVSKDGDSVVIKSWFALSKKDEQFRIRFVGNDTYWVDVEQFSISECFRRIQ